MLDTKQTRKPRQVYERRRVVRRTSKQRIHELLRVDPALSVDQIVHEVGCPRGHARVWRKNFFAPGHELEA